MIEYVTILALVLTMGIFLFWNRLIESLEYKLNEAGFDVKFSKKKKEEAKPSGGESTPEQSGESSQPSGGLGGTSGGAGPSGGTVIPSTSTLRRP